MIRWKQAVDGFADFGMTFGNPDFVAYAEAYGAKGSRVDAPKVSCRHWKRPLPAAECISSPCRSIIRRTRAFSSTNCVPMQRNEAPITEVGQGSDRTRIARHDSNDTRVANRRTAAAGIMFRQCERWFIGYWSCSRRRK